MTTNLMQASRQWATRPDDERLTSLDELLQLTTAQRAQSAERTFPFNMLKVRGDGDEVQLSRDGDRWATFNNYAFSQLASMIGAPAGYLNKLPTELAVSCVQQGLRDAVEQMPGKDVNALLLNQASGVNVRAITSEVYSRLFMDDWARMLIEAVEGTGYRVPPARPVRAGQQGTRTATEADVLSAANSFGLSIQVGDPIAPAGIYFGDRDAFVFMVDESRPIDDGSGRPMFKGFFGWNSDVGFRRVGGATFGYQTVCGNHIVWGATDVREWGLRHVGASIKSRAALQLHQYLGVLSHQSATALESRIKTARAKRLGETADEVCDTIAEQRWTRIPRKTVAEALQLTCEQGGIELHKVDPFSVWGIVTGLTALSQQSAYAERRTSIDREAGVILDRMAS